MFNKLKRSICNKFDHNWVFSFSALNACQYFRVCTRCHDLQRWEMISTVFNKEGSWISTVQYTDFGAREHLGDKYFAGRTSRLATASVSKTDEA